MATKVIETDEKMLGLKVDFRAWLQDMYGEVDDLDKSLEEDSLGRYRSFYWSLFGAYVAGRGFDLRSFHLWVARGDCYHVNA
jgi:hypothetical protein